MKTVYLSSTITDLAAHREAADRVIRQLGMQPILMNARDQLPQRLRTLAAADIFIGILAHRYGEIPLDKDRSLIELEYDEANRLALPRLFYVVDPFYNWPPEHLEADAPLPEGINPAVELRRFKERINTFEVRATFTTPENLAERLRRDLTDLIAELSTAPPPTPPDTSEPPPAPRPPARFGYSVLTLLLVAVCVIGLIWFILNRPQSTPPTPTPTPIFAADQIGAVIGAIPTDTSANLQLILNLRRGLENNGIPFHEIQQPVTDSNAAQELGLMTGARAVIWQRSVNNQTEIHFDSQTDYLSAPDLAAGWPLLANLPSWQLPLVETDDVGLVIEMTLAVFDLMRGDSNAALARLERLPQSQQIAQRDADSRFVVYFYLGAAQALQGDFSDALASLNIATQIDSANSALRLNRGTVYLRQGNAERAFNEYNRAVELAPDSPQVYLARGMAYVQVMNYERAVADFSRVLSLQPGDGVALTGRGNAYFLAGDYGLALADYDRAIALDESNALLYFNRGLTYRLLGRAEDAIADYTRALALTPENAQIYARRGSAYADLTEYASAIEDYTQALTLDPQFTDAYHDRGVAYADLGQTAEAIADFGRALALDPQRADTYENRGIVYQRMEEYELALMDFNRAVALAPLSVSGYRNRGQLYRLLENYRRALLDYDRALELLPDDADSLWGRGLTHYRAGNFVAALADYRRYEQVAGQLQPFMQEQITEMEAALQLG